MSREPSPRGSTSPLLLGLLLGLAGAGLAWLGFAGVEVRANHVASRAEEPEEAAGDEGFLVAGRSEPALRHAFAAAPGGPAAPPATDRRAAGARAPRSEREFLVRFLALAAAQPGALEARAGDVLAGEAVHAEKIALLEALVELRSPEAARWLAHAVLTQPDEPRAEARSVASHGLVLLAQGAARDPAACKALGALAFEAPAPAPGLRRRAASAWARHCPEGEIDALRHALLNERDELLVSGVLASLAEREPSPRIARLQLDFEALPRGQREE